MRCMTRRILYLVTEDWYFLSHRLPMARAAKEAGFEVHVATRIAREADAIRAEGFTLHGLSWRRGSTAPLGNAMAVLEIRRLLRRLRPAVLHNIALKPVLIGSAAAWRMPQVATVNNVAGLGSVYLGRSSLARGLRVGVSLALRRALGRDRSRAVVQNPEDAAALRGLGMSPDRIVVIAGSGVDTEHLTPLPEPEGSITVAYVGRMIEDKGLRTLMAAWRLLRQRGRRIDLVLAGEPDAENPRSVAAAELRQWTGEPGVEWLGHVRDVRDVWRRAHIAVLPSLREGLPKCLLEAAACGRPLVATDVPGCREIARQDQTALLVPVDDPAALADALERLADDPGLRGRFGEAARGLVVERFSAERIGREAVALYEEVIAGP